MPEQALQVEAVAAIRQVDQSRRQTRELAEAARLVPA
jgi:hypothetical protein